MPSTRSMKSRSIAALALVVILGTLAGSADAGVISGMIAKRRMKRQMQVQPPSTMSTSFHGDGMGASMAPAPLKDKFKNRFAFLTRRQANGSATTATTVPSVFPETRDPGLFRTAR